MGKHDQNSKNIMLGQSQILNNKDVMQYFGFLKEADDKFKEIYDINPEVFKIFAKSSDFNKLKAFLGEKFNPNSRYDRNVICSKQRFVMKTLESLESSVERPKKRICMPYDIQYMDWSQAFNLFSMSLSVESSEKKLELKAQIKKLL